MEQFTNSLLALSKLHSKLTNTPESEDFVTNIKAWGAGIFRLIVMGEIKKGKSSFINALLGVNELVPTSSDIATSTVYKIHYGAKSSYRVHFEPETGQKPIAITADEVEDYGTEKGNPLNKKHVDFIEVISDAELLKSGLVIIDTPGLGGLFKEHKKITWQHVPKADAVFFVTDSVESPIGMEELVHLSTVQKITPHIFFVQTKASVVSEEAAIARKNNNLEILSRHLKVNSARIPYFITDAVLKQESAQCQDMELLQISGYPALLHFMQNGLIAKQRQLIKSKAIRYAAPMLESLQTALSQRKEILQADSTEKQQATQKAIKLAQDELREWQQSRLPQLQKEINRGFKRIQSNCEEYCAQLRPNGEMQASLETEINKATSTKNLGEIIATIQEKLPETASVCITEVQKRYDQGIKQLFEELTSTENTESETSTEISQQSQLPNTNAFVSVLKGMEKGDASWNQIKSAAMGGTIGGNIGGLIGGVIGSIIPIVGTAAGGFIGAAIGALWGGVVASEERAEQALDSAKMQARNELVKNISSIYNNITFTLRKLNERYSQHVEDSLHTALTQRSQELNKAYQSIVDRSKMDAKALADAKTELKQDEEQLHAILRILKAQ